MTIQDLGMGLLTVYGEGIRAGSTFCSAVKVRQSLQQGCVGFLAYVKDTRVTTERPSSFTEVPIVSEFSDVFDGFRAF